MSNDTITNPEDKEQALKEICLKKERIEQLKKQFAISDHEIEQYRQLHLTQEPPNTNFQPTSSTYDQGKQVGKWLKNVLKK